MKKQISILVMLSLLVPINSLLSKDSLYISEFMAINTNTLQDEDGTYSDWIEIYNASATPKNLDGWCLSDEATNYSKWVFPAVTIDPNEYIIVFASGKNRYSEKDKLHTNFKLSGSGEFLALSSPGTSQYNSVFTPGYPEQYENISYRYHKGTYIYSSSPTPGISNDNGIFIAPPGFSKNHNFYYAPFKLELFSKQAGAIIYYTTDASTPDALSGIIYFDSINISKTTVIRAIAVINDTATSIPVTRSYIFPEDIFTQSEDQPGYPATWLKLKDSMVYEEVPSHYGMDSNMLNIDAVRTNIIESLKSLPIVSVVTDRNNLFSKSTHPDSGGIYMYTGENVGFSPPVHNQFYLGRGWERSASVEYFNSNIPYENLDFQANCGIKIHGGVSRTTRRGLRFSFKIGFKGEYGPTKLRERVFGEDSPNQYDRLILRGEREGRLENSVIDPWVKSSIRDMGQNAPRSKFVHLYLNGLYWGMYNLSEQLDENYMRDNFGGDEDDYDIIKDFIEVEAGDTLAWNQLITLADDITNYQILLGNKTDGTPDPSNEKLLNPINLIDYILVNIYSAPSDWDHRNWVAARRRSNSEGFRFLTWDAESGLKNDVSRSVYFFNRESNYNRPSGLFFDLMKNKEFRDLFIGRVNKHFFEDGALTPDPCLRRYNIWLAEIDTAILAELAKWNSSETDIWNTSQHLFIYDYFPNRTEIVFNQILNAGMYPRIETPGFNSSLSHIPEEFQLFMTAPEYGEIRYSVDSTDPGYYSYASSSSIKVYNGKAIPLPAEGEKLTIYARTKLDTLWSALVKKTFTIGDSPLFSINNSIEAKNSLLCYPNPVKDKLTIELQPEFSKKTVIQVFDNTGRLIINRNVQGSSHIIEMRDLSPGIYLIKVSNSNEKPIIAYITKQ